MGAGGSMDFSMAKETGSGAIVCEMELETTGDGEGRSIGAAGAGSTGAIVTA